jgi:hypothetical protein
MVRTWTFDDGCGNISSVSQTITVFDNTPPQFTFVPADKAILCGETPVFGTPTATDNCGGVTITSADQSSLDACGNGTYTRTWTATDACGNSTTTQQVLTLNDCGDFKLVKTTNGAVNSSKDWSFTLSIDGIPTYSQSTLNDGDGILFDNVGPLSASSTYTICETNIPAGFTAVWKVDANGDGIAELIVPAYNPDFPLDEGKRCVDFGAGTAYPLPVGNTGITCTLVIEVDNSYPGGDPRTPGYWKNWNRCTSGGQADNADRNGGADEGYWLLDDILNSPGIAWCDFVLDGGDCETAILILDQRDVDSGKKRANDAAYTLAMHLLAAQLNFAAGAETCPEATDAALAAEQLLCDLGFDGTGSYLRPKDHEYQEALDLAQTLDSYNNGCLCGECTGEQLAEFQANYDAKKAAVDYSGDPDDAPEGIRIHVYPNPSSTGVTIQFEVPEDRRVILDLFNLTGQNVGRYYDAKVETGFRNQVRIEQGELDPGTYIYRLYDQKKVYQGKLIIIK